MEGAQSEAAKSSVLDRMKDPLVWARLSTGIRIEDLQEGRYEEALQLIKDYFLTEETLCRSVELWADEDSVQGLLNVIKFWMMDTISLVAIEEETGVVVGVLVNRIVELLERTRTFSRIRIVEKRGEPFKSVMEMRWDLHKVCDIFERYGVDKFFRFYGICVHPKFRGKAIGMGLMKSGVRLAELLGMPLVMGIFTSARSQSLAFKIGMETVYERMYSTWTTEDDNAIFSNPGIGNFSAMVMAMPMCASNSRPLSIYDYESKLKDEK